MNRLISGALGAAVLSTLATLGSSALAHAVLETTSASPNSFYKGVVRIGHGCKGSPTTKVAVSIPEGVIAAKPQPKPGWQVSTVKGAFARSYSFHGASVSEGTKEIVWSGGQLPDDFFDDFVFVARITDAFEPGATVYFPVEQVCEQGRTDWAQVPAPGADPGALKEPAPGVRIVAASEVAAAPAPSVVKAGSLAIAAPWTRATPGGAKVAGGFLRITNTGQVADRLVAATLEGASEGQIHEMAVTDGVMRMRELEDGLEIKPGETTELAPGGYHLMFFGLKQQLKEGGTVKGTLVFEKAGTVPVAFAIRGIGAGAGGGSHSGAHQH